MSQQVPVEHLSICPKCGRAFVNFCVYCAKIAREEKVEALMDEYGLTVEQLIQTLASEILCDEMNFAALRLAIEMRSMKPATKTDVTSGGQPLAVDSDAQKRIVDKISKILKSNPEG